MSSFYFIQCGWFLSPLQTYLRPFASKPAFLYFALGQNCPPAMHLPLEVLVQETAEADSTEAARPTPDNVDEARTKVAIACRNFMRMTLGNSA